jgi:hypothetical protein
MSQKRDMGHPNSWRVERWATRRYGTWIVVGLRVVEGRMYPMSQRRDMGHPVFLRFEVWNNAYFCCATGAGVAVAGSGAPQSWASTSGFSLPVPQRVEAVFCVLLPSPARFGVKSPIVAYS